MSNKQLIKVIKDDFQEPYKHEWEQIAECIVTEQVPASDVAKFFVQSLDMKNTFGKIYNLGGPQSYNWIEIIDTISNASSKNKWKIPAPVEPIKLAATLLEWLPFFPITKDQLTMLLEGNTWDSSSSFDEFKIQPTEFSVESLSYLSAN